MSGSLLRVRHAISERTMCHPAFEGRGARVDSRGQQRVREPDLSGVDLDHAGAFGRGKGIVRREIQPRCGGDKVRRGLRGHRRNQEGRARI